MLILQGLRRLAHFDALGFLFFDASRRGFWRSFFAALVCLPVWGLAEYQQTASMAGDAALRFLAVQFIAYAVSWLAYPLVALRVADMFGVWPHYYRYMVAYNWFQPVMQLAWLPLLLLNLQQDGLPPAMLAVFWLAIQGVQLAYGWFLARNGLQVQASTAAALTVIDFLLGLTIDQISSQI